MAYEIKNIDPLDLNSNIGVGIAIPFNARGIFKVNYTTADQLKSNIINYLFTNKNERIFNNRFGANLRQELFQQISNGSIDDLKASISQGISNYFPNLILQELKVLGSPNNNLVSVSIKYSIPNTNINDELNFSISNA